eukprot:TRINITY_DN37177_c0_g1_i1.p1 TRINITY_DN37177_c0_g1~~TRINITY_DN37177_c0_g1_i1.p1  ORF type:complete len:204 (-),score=35.84 TRINITY_DN37177_c0_g1_i1:442-1053(-)
MPAGRASPLLAVLYDPNASCGDETAGPLAAASSATVPAELLAGPSLVPRSKGVAASAFLGCSEPGSVAGDLLSSPCGRPTARRREENSRWWLAQSSGSRSPPPGQRVVVSFGSHEDHGQGSVFAAKAASKEDEQLWHEAVTSMKTCVFALVAATAGWINAYVTYNLEKSHYEHELREVEALRRRLDESHQESPRPNQPASSQA